MEAVGARGDGATTLLGGTEAPRHSPIAAAPVGTHRVAVDVGPPQLCRQRQSLATKRVSHRLRCARDVGCDLGCRPARLDLSTQPGTVAELATGWTADTAARRDDIMAPAIHDYRTDAAFAVLVVADRP
jgi:hypothetical protein